MLTTRVNESPRARQSARAIRVAGMFLVAKLQEQARATSTYQAAKNARKMGLPLSHALLILGGGV